jgi:hypothetical protein
MTTDDTLLFIDANKYLDLYRTVRGKSILGALTEQAPYIFVTQHVVDEVNRNTVNETAAFLTTQFKPLTLKTYAVHDHLFGTSQEQSQSISGRMKEIGQQIVDVNRDIAALAMSIMQKVSQSQDEVSAVLAPIFAKAVPHSDAELRRARERKERGEPPGKKTDTSLGDQLNWEQMLSRFAGKKKLWIVTRNQDYGIIYDDTGFVNRSLYEELRKVSHDAEAFLFANIPDAIQHFAKIAGVKADKLPPPKEIEEIKKEEETLQPLDWLTGGNDTAMAVARIAQMEQRRAIFSGAAVAANLGSFVTRAENNSSSDDNAKS